MTSFDEREDEFETEFSHREELKFKARERAVKSLALWAAQRLSKTSQDSEAYARDLVVVDLANPNPDVALEHIAADLNPRGITQQEGRRVMDQFLAQAEISVRGSSSQASD
ncbi:DUF1476 domain-containing protein [Bradyrhizobium japonicum]|uniref:DUF1476 domain-containing protein n=1 Tax=Bradyrhizobium japonicum TaxID=375 RepID=UPI0004BC86EC|nr:DUF1476 domain-containing protein [Bradyrhizobium japonicum]